MPEAIQIIARNDLNRNAWDDCVAVSAQRIVYGYSWYLDAVLPSPFWKWVGLVLLDKSGTYQAVMPVPLRRKGACQWVVHQPFFCQFLSLFSREEALDPTPFLALIEQRFPYGSTFKIRQPVADVSAFDTVRPLTTHVLDLSVGYETIYRNYTRDRRLNLRRGQAENWLIIESTDPEHVLTLFRQNHADTIPGGVAEWAYTLFANLVEALAQRKLVILRYAVWDGRIEAGALFVQEGNRIIYLFNAASKSGRLGNARTVLIDQIIQEKAGDTLIFDFESPEKDSIAHFYRSFGAAEESFWDIRWNRLGAVRKVIRTIVRGLKPRSRG